MSKNNPQTIIKDFHEAEFTFFAIVYFNENNSSQKCIDEIRNLNEFLALVKSRHIARLRKDKSHV